MSICAPGGGDYPTPGALRLSPWSRFRFPSLCGEGYGREETVATLSAHDRGYFETGTNTADRLRRQGKMILCGF